MTELPICERILGHSSGSVTRLYIHNSEELMRAYLSRVCEAVYAAKEEVS